MALLLLIIVAACFVVSLLPFMFPGAVVGLLGVALNDWLAGVLGRSLGVGPGALLAGPPGQAALTVQGALTVYVPLLVVLLFVLWGRGR
jgi:hypothetical protein